MPRQNKKRQAKTVEPKGARREVELPLTYKEAALKKVRERCKRRIETFELTPQEYELLRIPSPERKIAWDWELSGNAEMVTCLICSWIQAKGEQ